MKQRPDFGPFVLWHGAFEPGNYSLRELTIRNGAYGVERNQCAAIERNGVAAECVLSYVRHRKRRGAIVFLQGLCCRADVLLLKRLDVELVHRLEYAMQCLLKPCC